MNKNRANEASDRQMLNHEDGNSSQDWNLRKKVGKFLKAKSIISIWYSTWVANLVPVRRKNS